MKKICFKTGGILQNDKVLFSLKVDSMTKEYLEKYLNLSISRFDFSKTSKFRQY